MKIQVVDGILKGYEFDLNIKTKKISLKSKDKILEIYKNIEYVTLKSNEENNENICNVEFSIGNTKNYAKVSFDIYMYLITFGLK